MDTRFNAAIGCELCIPGICAVSLLIARQISFINWNMPHVATRLSGSRSHDPVPPGNVSDIMVATPSAESPPPSPRSAGSQIPALSPTAMTVMTSVKVKRAKLFVQGRHAELLEGLNSQEKM
jgi:hypothetical protein